MLPDFWPLLLAASFFAGMVDAVGGGGGLIQVPALLSLFPAAPIATLFGTNKVASVVGTAAAALHFVRRVRMPWLIVVPATIAAFVGSFGGAIFASALPRRIMLPLVIALMIGAALYTFLKKDFGHLATREPVAADRPKAAMLGGGVGFYDGIFGPGTGSFLIFGFVRLFGLDMVRANAATKIVNATTNVAAILFFAFHGAVMWPLALTMAAANFCGAQVGARVALRFGSKFLRKVFLVAVVVLIVKLVIDFLRG
ncbi:MAG: TSUP family transporter [Phyllobacteriaceae bacterium]|nr:TSUP family transporter [Phyllobacteriaceae bacterium]